MEQATVIPRVMDENLDADFDDIQWELISSAREACEFVPFANLDYTRYLMQLNRFEPDATHTVEDEGDSAVGS